MFQRILAAHTTVTVYSTIQLMDSHSVENRLAKTSIRNQTRNCIK